MRLIIRHGDNGKTFTVNVDDLFSIQLEGNTTTGYVWSIYKIDKAVVKSLDSKYLPFHSSPLVGVGSGGMTILDFQARSAGVAKIQLKLVRKWAPADKSIETFAVTINVKKRGG